MRREKNRPPAACPHCGVIIDPPPSGNRKCPDCREPIVVRTRHGEKMLLTPSGAERYDYERAQEVKRNKARRHATNIGATDADWETTEAELAERFGSSPSPGDVFWSIANRTAMEAARAGEWHRAGMAHFSMGLHLRDEGRDFTGVRQEAMRCMVRDVLQSASRMGWDDPVVRVVGCRPDCEVCAPDDGRQVDPEELLSDDPPVPHDCEWCACSVRLDIDEFDFEASLDEILGEPEPRRGGLLRRLFGG